MNIETEQQFKNTQQKLTSLDEQISRATLRPPTTGGRDSLQALARMANQLREEMIRYRSRSKRRAS